MDILKTGVSTGAKKSRKRIEMNPSSEISGSRGVKGTETETGYFVRDTSFDR